MTHARSFGSRFFLTIAISIALSFALTMSAHAQSVSWSYTYPDALCSNSATSGEGKNQCTTAFVNPNVTINEYAQVINAQTGAPIACGSTVPSGTEVALEFPAHQSQDIYWFATGSAYDSPYGQWVNGAAAGTSCVAQNWIGIYNASAADQGNIYGNLTVDPPAESLGGLTGLGCTQTSSGAICNTPVAGTYNAVFNYAATYGNFYGYHEHAGPNGASTGTCDGGLMGTAVYTGVTGSGYSAQGESIGYTQSGPYTLQVPAQQISCNITVTGSSTTTTVGTPTVTNSTNSCPTDDVPSYTIVANDSNSNAQIHYGISWDTSGAIEEWVPATGYVPAGTPETVEQVGGGGPFEVIAEDSSGNESTWVSVTSASCTPACANGQISENGACVNACGIGYVQQGNTCVFNACPQGYVQQGNECVTQQCGGYICQAGNLYEQNSDCSVSTSPVQVCGYGCSGNACSAPPSPEIAIWKVVPTLVKSGQTSSVQWQAENVSSCTITGTNGDSWTGLSGSQTTLPIIQQTIYSIFCLGVPGSSPPSASDSATVNIVPVFQEQ